MGEINSYFFAYNFLRDEEKCLMSQIKNRRDDKTRSGGTLLLDKKWQK